MRTIIFSLMLWGSLTQVLAQQQLVFTVEVNNDSVLLGNSISVVFSLKNGQAEDFVFPAFEGFQLLAGPNTSTQMSIVNGAMSQRANYTFFLEPQEVGDFYIEPASVKVGDSYLETDPVLVRVYPNPAGIIQVAPPPAGDPSSPWGDTMFGEDLFGRDFFQRDFFQDDFFGDLFRRVPSPDLLAPPSGEAPDSIQQQPKKRKTTKL